MWAVGLVVTELVTGMAYYKRPRKNVMDRARVTAAVAEMRLLQAVAAETQDDSAPLLAKLVTVTEHLLEQEPGDRWSAAQVLDALR